MVIEIFREKFQDLFNTELEIINTKLTHYYNAINKSDNEAVQSIEVQLEENKTLRFHDPQNHKDIDEIMSTAHLRCLGFAILLSRIERHGDEIGFIAIDDPIYSVDSDHRYNIVKLLEELGSKYQLVITSCDRNFFEILCNYFPQNTFEPYRANYAKHEQSSELIHTRLEKKPGCFIQTARERLLHKDYRSTCLYTRLALETCLKNLAEKIKFEIPVGKNFTLSRASKLKNKIPEKYPINTSEIGKVFHEIEQNRYFNKLIENSAMDQDAHAPDDIRGFSYSHQEIEELIKIVETFKSEIEKLQLNKPIGS